MGKADWRLSGTVLVLGGIVLGLFGAVNDSPPFLVSGLGLVLVGAVIRVVAGGSR